MDNMNNIFTTLNEGAAVAPVETAGATNNQKKEKVEVMKAALKETVLSDPQFQDKLRSLSESVEVVNSLGFGDTGNIIVDKSKKTDGRELAVTSQIVGYRVKNIGATPIKYQIEVWAQGEDGKFVPTKTEKTLAAGAIADLTRQYMTMLCAMPEISFQLANGKIIKGSGSKGDKGIKAELESYYFRFDKDENGEKKQINDDTVKLNVGEKGADGKWIVKADFVEVFGFLNNPKEGGKGGRTKGEGSKFTAQDLAANYVNRLISEAGL